MSAPVLTNYFEQTTFACGHTRLATHGMGRVGLNPALLNKKSSSYCPSCAHEDAIELRIELGLDTEPCTTCSGSMAECRRCPHIYAKRV